MSRRLLAVAALVAGAMYSQAPRSGRAAVETPVNALANPAGVNKSLRLFWLSSGRQDFLYQANGQFAESLEAKGVKVMVRETEGEHVWSVWRNNPNESAALLFK